MDLRALKLYDVCSSDAVGSTVRTLCGLDV